MAPNSAEIRRMAVAKKPRLAGERRPRSANAKGCGQTIAKKGERKIRGEN
jgi:hypothetical protein